MGFLLKFGLMHLRIFCVENNAFFGTYRRKPNVLQMFISPDQPILGSARNHFSSPRDNQEYQVFSEPLARAVPFLKDFCSIFTEYEKGEQSNELS